MLSTFATVYATPNKNASGQANAPNANATVQLKKFVYDWLNEKETEKYFSEISDAIWSYAELGLEEYNTADLIQYVMEQEGFEIDRGVADMPTALLATYKKGSDGPVIAIMGEFDALPLISQEASDSTRNPVVEGGPGHGCTHNTMATAGAAATIAVKKAMDKFNINGTVRYYGSPAEESLVPRPFFIDAGLFDDVDIIIDNHGGGSFGTSWSGKVGTGTALYSFLVTFKGKTGHAASPWTGTSALKPVELMMHATNLLREHLMYTHRMHYAVIDGGEAPNVMPDKATIWYFIREHDDRIDDMLDRVLKCAEGSAIATGTTYDVQMLAGIHQRYGNKVIAEAMYKNIKEVGMPEWSEEEQLFAKAIQKELGKPETGLRTEINDAPTGPPATFVGGASSDMGSASLYRPTASLSFPSNGPGDSHHWTSVAGTGSTIAHKGIIAGAKVMAATALDFLTDQKLVDAAWAEFNELKAERPYESRVQGIKPPLGLNKEVMEKYRPLMEQYYKEPEWYPGPWSLEEGR
ncbi:MAG: amidohydrolase [Tissierellia bacterium]|nr:amidohydrolase [Tissierellia bacterium]